MKCLLRLIASATTSTLFVVNAAAQSVQLDEQSMYEAWSRQQPQFESLSSEADNAAQDESPRLLPSSKPDDEYGDGNTPQEKQARGNHDRRQ